MKKIGFTIGKFAPLHKGHQYLIEKGIKETEEFYVVIYDTNVTKIPLKERANWIKQLYPEVKILYAKNPPMQYGLDKESVKIQTDYLKNIVKEIPVTDFYSSEPYGEFVAKYLNVKDNRVDEQRIEIPICATNIRNNLPKYKEYLSNIVFEDYSNKIKNLENMHK